MAKEMHKSKSSGSNQVSFHKQLQRERGISEQQGESQCCDTGKIFKTNISATKLWVQSLKFPWSGAQGVSPVSAQQGFHPQEGKEQMNAKRCIDQIPLRNHTRQGRAV